MIDAKLFMLYFVFSYQILCRCYFCVVKICSNCIPHKVLWMRLFIEVPCVYAHKNKTTTTTKNTHAY